MKPAKQSVSERRIPRGLDQDQRLQMVRWLAEKQVHDWARGQNNPKLLAAELYPTLSIETAHKRFLSETNKDNGTAKFSLVAAFIAARLSGDHYLFEWIMWELGYSCIPVEKGGDVEDLKESAMEATKEHGDFVGSIVEAIRDKKITGTEIALIEKECREAHQALSETMQKVKIMAEA